MEQRYTETIAAAVQRPPSQVKQMLRVLREAELVPGHGIAPTDRHLARIVLALGTDQVGHVVPLVESLRNIQRAVPAAVPVTAEDMLTLLIETLPSSPVFGGDFDIDDGFLHIGADSITLECLTLGGHRVAIRYGAPFMGIVARVTVPIGIIKQLIESIRTAQ